jgi:hypothetical protein
MLCIYAVKNVLIKSLSINTWHCSPENSPAKIYSKLCAGVDSSFVRFIIFIATE